MINHNRNFTNRCNALKSLSLRPASGKRVSSQNSCNHGLNSVSNFDLSLDYQAIIDLIVGLLNYQCVMDAYYDTYTNPQPVDEFLHDLNLKYSISIFREFFSPWTASLRYVRHGRF